MNKQGASFEVVAIITLALTIVVAGVSFALGDRSGAQSYKDCPHYVRVHRRTFSTFEQKLENERMGQVLSPLYLDFDRTNNVCLGYGGQYTWCHTKTIQTSGSDIRYKLDPPADGGTWTMHLRRPRQCDYLHPRGLWAMYVRETVGSWSDSSWVLFNEDGTGYCGWGGYNAVSASEEAACNHGRPCTWHVTQLDLGCIIVLEYEGGQSTITVTL